MIIQNAADVLLSQNPGTLPDPSGALLDWFQYMAFTLIRKRVVDYSVVEDKTEISTMGVRQPMKPQQLMMKPEGQRKWRWETIHCLPDLVLNVDDRIRYMDVPYRVMERLDWREYGFIEYHVVEDYTP